MRHAAAALAGLFLFPCLLLAAKPAAWTVEDVVFAEAIHDIQLSPDGRWAVWVHDVPNKERDEEVGNLVRLNLTTGRETPLTRAPEGCGKPRWSPDGKRLAFLSSRPAVRGRADEETRSQIWLLDPSGGEPWPLTDWTRGVLHYDWAGPGALVFAAQEKASLRARTLKEDKDDAIVVEEDRHEPPVRLFRVELSSKKIARLTDNSDRISTLAVSPDGRHAVTLHERSLRYTFDNKIKPHAFLHDLETGRSRPILREAHWNIRHVRWQPDSRGFYVVNMHSSQPRFNQAGVFHLHHFDLTRNVSAPVDLAWNNGLADQENNDEEPGLLVTRDGFLGLLADGARNKLARYTRTEDGWRRDFLTGEHAGHIFAFQASTDGKTLLYAHSTASTPTRWYRAEIADSRLDRPQSFAVLNPRQRKLPHARSEVIRWKGARGDEVEGILYYPHKYRPGAKCPLVVMIHGGPAAADLDSGDEDWMYAPNLVCQRGAFVLKPNYHGSSNYGLKWLESITRGRYGDLETVDVEKGVDHLIARGLVDADRLALCGWSNGAILTNRLTVQTTRYKAAVAGAGNVEYISDWGNCEFGDAFNRYYLGASPLEEPIQYLVKSPFFRLDRVRTPTLILFGAADRTVPVHQGWVHYRALQQLGKADVRFVLFPGEKHLFSKLSHRRRKLKEELAWLDRYLFHVPAKSTPALKPDSPLAWALRRREASRDSGRYGLLDHDRLIPETVAHGELRVGRFEVTRAQFAQFDKAYKIESGRENYPSNGITFDQSKKYCAWLSELTGRRYRLPTAEEAEELYAPSEAEENTLDHWAGYAVNPDDALRLREQVKELGGEAPLLKEVGEFHAAGTEAAVFDLGGNVAEWVTTKDGKGILCGGSADLPADRNRKTIQAAPAYRGFRVIEEKASH
ncbi:MAG TPA: prolyl oligopeptidase family serine peptidase [Gemmataceae bacterium]|jgi:dipeptidyl aminopeptidase/acylaminoacyl peptidase